MLKKSDLSKQFELVVRQEIKNYQDSHNFVLQSLRDIKESISVVEFQTRDSIAKLQCTQATIFNEIENLKSSQKSNLLETQSKINDLHEAKKDIKNTCQVIAEDLEMKTFSIEENRKAIQILGDLISKITMSLHSLSENVKRFMENLRNRNEKDFKRMKEEILSIPSDVDLLRKEYDEKINTRQIEADSVFKEIKIFRKDMIVIQKQIENIYTLIERIRKKEVIE